MAASPSPTPRGAARADAGWVQLTVGDGAQSAGPLNRHLEGQLLEAVLGTSVSSPQVTRAWFRGGTWLREVTQGHLFRNLEGHGN